ncbi:CPBP family intramembrane glutamic endopeptidase [Brachybacterium sp. DNPG3]
MSSDGTGFLEKVRAEELPTRLRWGAPEWVALASVPAIFLGGWLSSLVTDDVGVRAVADTLLRVVVFVAVVVLNRERLGRHWTAFWRAPVRSLAIVLAGMILIQVVISVLGSLLRGATGYSASGAASSDASASVAFAVLLIASFGPTVTALIEDFAFRHTLMMTFPAWNRWWTAALLVIVNALLFGAVHYNNFGGHLVLTLSYAGAGLLMNLTYLWTRNIWHVLLMHGLNNLILGGPIVVILAQALGAAVG